MYSGTEAIAKNMCHPKPQILQRQHWKEAPHFHIVLVSSLKKAFLISPSNTPSPFLGWNGLIHDLMICWTSTYPVVLDAMAIWPVSVAAASIRFRSRIRFNPTVQHNFQDCLPTARFHCSSYLLHRKDATSSQISIRGIGFLFHNERSSRSQYTSDAVTEPNQPPRYLALQ